MKRVLILVVLGLLLTNTGVPEETERRFPRLPNFLFSDLDGQPSVDLEHFAGCAVLLSFWASWCGPCRYEMPELERLQRELEHRGFVLLTINMDRSATYARKFLEQTGIDVPVYRMELEDLQKLEVGSLPTNILIDSDRRPVRVFQGYSARNVEDLRRHIEEMLNVGEADREEVAG
ncbi:MAG: TlpA family protein disulfide reductase [bacterium]|nr:TlpA family protein disulfide reductase [bacterium]